MGGGPGGYTCAIRLAKLGAKAALVEEGALGGVCANSGCIPVKALHASAKILGEVRGAGRHGIKTGEPVVDYVEMRRRAHSVAQMSAKGVEILLKTNGVDVFRGRGKLESAGSVRVGGETLHAEN
ncbi:MAG: FAD-dependent oxidoreductase, partial [Candidatus Micrarchaeota archaeon]